MNHYEPALVRLWLRLVHRFELLCDKYHRGYSHPKQANDVPHEACKNCRDFPSGMESRIFAEWKMTTDLPLMRGSGTLWSAWAGPTWAMTRSFRSAYIWNPSVCSRLMTYLECGDRCSSEVLSFLAIADWLKMETGMPRIIRNMPVSLINPWWRQRETVPLLSSLDQTG